MAFTLKRKLYESFPVAIKRSVRLIPFSWLAGKAYRECFRRGDWCEQANKHELRRYQEHQLGFVLRFSVSQIPAYQYLRQTVENFRPFDALKAFPLLDKETLQKNFKHYLPKDFDRIPHYEVTTGGTSGNQLKLYLDDCSQSIEMGFGHRLWKLMGYTPRHRKATFRGVAFSHLPMNVFWQYNPIYNEIQFSPFHMSEKNISLYIKELIRYRPEYLHGYPSAIDTIANYLIRNNMLSELPEIKAAFLVSEGCTEVQRNSIERAFRTRVFSSYGHSERLIFGGECEKNTTYHQFPDYGILEIINDNGEACEKEGERGEIVGTGLNNFCMPLIRYRTGDFATRMESNCDCGRCWDRFTKVEGRWKQDMVIGRTGAKISIAALNMHGPLFERIVRYQYYQDKVGSCVLKMMAAPGFTETDRKAIEVAYKNKVGNEVDFVVQIVQDIPLTGRGKLKLLDSRIINIKKNQNI